jgi:hypothetical protein
MRFQEDAVGGRNWYTMFRGKDSIPSFNVIGLTILGQVEISVENRRHLIVGSIETSANFRDPSWVVMGPKEVESWDPLFEPTTLLISADTTL